MSYGVSLYNADGSQGFSTSDITWMQVDHFTVPANGSVSKNYPAISGMTIITQSQMVNDPPGSQEAYAPNITIGASSVSVAPYSGKTSEETVVMVLAQD